MRRCSKVNASLIFFVAVFSAACVATDSIEPLKRSSSQGRDAVEELVVNLDK